jgi:pyruvate ferredoxin oxidoreductase delta subunit
MRKPPTWREVEARGEGRSNNVVPVIIKQSPTGSWRTSKPIVDDKKCTRCGICVTYCPDGVITVKNVSADPDYEYCKGCGICANECPVEAIKMVREGTKESS